MFGGSLAVESGFDETGISQSFESDTGLQIVEFLVVEERGRAIGVITPKQTKEIKQKVSLLVTFLILKASFCTTTGT